MEQLFKKYPDIENHYRTKFINHFLEKYPELNVILYEITEKLHGCNLQLVFRPDEEVIVCSRKRIIPRSENFNDVWNVLEKRKREISKLQEYTNKNINGTLRIYGELFGLGINKGIYYGEEKDIRFFNAEISSRLLEQFLFVRFLTNLTILHMEIPHIALVYGLDKALAFDTRFNSKIFGKEDNICEGVVIKPYYNNYYNKNRRIFYIKTVNDGFKAKQREKKIPKEYTEIDRLNEVFKEYINDNRVQSVFSKEGEIQEPRDIGKYIKLVLEDTKEEFLKDHEDKVKNFDKKELKGVYNVGSVIAHILQQYL